MEVRYSFKNGYRVGSLALSYQLDVLTEGMDCKDAYNLSQAVDKEYKGLLADQFNFEEGSMWEDGNRTEI